MPVPSPQAGQAFICLITCFLFLSIAVGGGCLVAYTLVADTPNWLAYVGIFFVCLPWIFWIVTFMYRITSRAFGFRMVIGGGGGNATNQRDVAPSDNDEGGDGNAESSPETTPRGGQCGDDEGVGERKGGNKGNQSNSSIASHESEMPLAISMAA